MSRPRNSKDKQRLQLKTVALMNGLRIRTGAQNVSQFSEWINQRTEHLGWPDMKDSNKWYKYFKGDVSQEPRRVLRLLKELFPETFSFFNEGPARIWTAMWSQSAETLWSICGFTGCEYPDQYSDEGTCLTGQPLAFCESAYNFECSLLMKIDFGETLELRDLTDSIAIYRIHQMINSIHKTDEIGPYRCVRICLDDTNIISELKSLGIYELIDEELTKTEIARLKSEPCYRISVGAEDLDFYASHPFLHCPIQERMSMLRIG